MLIGACGGDPDGERIDGVWVGEPADCTEDAPPELSCERLIACAVEQEWPNGTPRYLSALVFDKPERLQDGTLINYGVGGRVVVFALPNENRAAQLIVSTDGCTSA